MLERKFLKKSNYISIDEKYKLLNNDQFKINYKLFTNTSSIKINIEIMKKADSNPHALYFPLTINTGRNTKCHFETAGAILQLDKDHLPFSCKHFVTVQNWISYHGSGGGVTVSSKDCPLWQIGGLNFGKFDKNNKVERKYKMISAWLYNNYWNTNFLADESKLIKFEFVINFEKQKDLLMRIKDIMPHIYEPVVHNYQDRGASKKRNNIKMLNILTKNIYLTDVKKQNKKSYLYLMNYSSKNEQFNISSNYVTINNLKVENTANKLLERVQSDSSGKYLINFLPYERKVLVIS